MLTMAEVIDAHTSLKASDVMWLEHLVAEWHLLADLAFSDLILWVPDVDDNVFWACAQVRPTTGPTALEDDVVGEDVHYDPEHQVTEAYLSHEIVKTSGNQLSAGIPVDVHTIPVVRDGRVIGIVEAHTNRMGVRAPGALEDAYLEAADVLSGMVHRCEYPTDTDKSVPWVSPRVGDGMIRVKADGIVAYASPNALSAYRRLGLTADLEGENLAHVTMALLRDRAPVEMSLPNVLRGQGQQEVEVETADVQLRLRIIKLADDSGPVGQLVLCRDTTELRSRERQLVTKDATIREIHHRVKNNLQTVAALLRLQARRISLPEAKGALSDAMKRVGAIAVVHEILSQAFDTAVKFDDVADRLLRMVVDVAATGEPVQLKREGTFGYVPADVATSLSLVLTELCQNAIEHGLGQQRGVVWVRPQQTDGRLVVEVTNDGEPLPPDFEIGSSNSLGLSIVTTLVDDLGGEFSLRSGDKAVGTVARVSIPLG
ncbi:sensor histidine kinase [Micropruina glycogenica]|uniref:histidine kinase n=1 Tax=Micropruina glycogenica TaxID=75385 RepID=A0A2N9JFC5_9ACTN|nr:PAS domain-containing sensor histidine kinase [Micropruina glycogenica]SPD86208.1 putative sensor histidine kinase pdtaS [Micropruina glycogenica]